MRARRRLVSFLVVGVPAAWSLVFSPLDAHANGRLPAAHQLVVSPTNPSFFALEATFGLLISQNTGASFGWVCEPALGYPSTTNWDPSIALSATSVLATIPLGVAVSMDQGCTWQTTLSAHAIDIAVRADNPHAALALASSYSGLTDAGDNAFSTQVFATTDDGKNWTPQGGSIQPDVQVETIDIAPSDPNTIYIGGGRTILGDDGSVTRTGIILASTNAGASYTATEIPLELPNEFESSAFISAIDPNNPKRVYVRISLSTASVTSVDRLVVSEDGAATFQTAYQGRGSLPGFALSSDGSQVFLGDSVAGVFLAAAPAADSGAPFSFALRSPTVVGCLTWSGGDLYACTGQAKNPALKELGVSKDDGMTFSPAFLFGCVSGPLACAGSLDSTCTPELMSLEAAIGPCSDGGAEAGSPVDAGEPDAAASTPDAGAQTPRPRSASCGCEAGEAASELGGLSAMTLLVALLLRRLRRRRTGSV